jgi:hypothetical protein
LDAVSRCLGADFRAAAEQDGPLCLAAPQAPVWLRAQDAALTGPGGTGVPAWLLAAVWLPHEWGQVGSQAGLQAGSLEWLDGSPLESRVLALRPVPALERGEIPRRAGWFRVWFQDDLEQLGAIRLPAARLWLAVSRLVWLRLLRVLTLDDFPQPGELERVWLPTGLRLPGEWLMAGPQDGSRVEPRWLEFRLLGAWSPAGLPCESVSAPRSLDVQLQSGLQDGFQAVLSCGPLSHLPAVHRLPEPHV